MDDATIALMGNQLLAKHCSEAECVELVALARSAKLGSVPYGRSLLSMAQSIERCGPEQKDKLLEIARSSREEQDALTELVAFLRETRAPLIQEIALLGRAEGDAKREFREKVLGFLRKGYPAADDATLYLTIGQCFEDVPGVWTFNARRCVLALRNLRRFG